MTEINRYTPPGLFSVPTDPSLSTDGTGAVTRSGDPTVGVPGNDGYGTSTTRTTSGPPPLVGDTQVLPNGPSLAQSGINKLGGSNLGFLAGRLNVGVGTTNRITQQQVDRVDAGLSKEDREKLDKAEEKLLKNAKATGKGADCKVAMLTNYLEKKLNISHTDAQALVSNMRSGDSSVARMTAAAIELTLVSQGKRPHDGVDATHLKGVMDTQIGGRNMVSDLLSSMANSNLSRYAATQPQPPKGTVSFDSIDSRGPLPGVNSY